MCMKGYILSCFMQVTNVVPAMSEEVKDALVKDIRRRMTPQPLKIRADIEMKCFQFDGVLHIKVLFCFFLLRILYDLLTSLKNVYPTIEGMFS